MMKIVFGLYMFVIGSIFASFFGVIIDRVPKNLSIVKPGSHCNSCGHVLKWYENIPVISYLFLRGKCSSCGSRIGLFSLVYEVIGGLSLLLVCLRFGLTINTLLVSIVTLMMLLIAGYDYVTHFVPDLFIVLLLVSCISLFAYRVFILDYEFMSYVVSIVLSLLFFVILRFIMTKILKKESLGIGDIYVTSIVAMLLDPMEIVVAILIASLVGLVIAIVMIKTNKIDRSDEIAFCPYLCFGFYVMLLYGSQIIDLMLRCTYGQL